MSISKDTFRVQWGTPEGRYNIRCEGACFTVKSKHGLVTIVGICRRPRCVIDDFILIHICTSSKANCVPVVGDFNASHINWIEPTTQGRYFDGSLLPTIIRCSLVQRVAKPTHVELEHES